MSLDKSSSLLHSSSDEKWWWVMIYGCKQLHGVLDRCRRPELKFPTIIIHWEIIRNWKTSKDRRIDAGYVAPLGFVLRTPLPQRWRHLWTAPKSRHHYFGWYIPALHSEILGYLYIYIFIYIYIYLYIYIYIYIFIYIYRLHLILLE